MYYWIENIQEHTMESVLLPYICIKIHPMIELFTGSKIIVRGKYDRKNSIISSKEKNDKLCNWKRPTVEFSDDSTTLYVNCFPGIDYACHYASLIKTFFNCNSLQAPEIIVEIPTQEKSLVQLSRLNIQNVPESDIIIFGKVEKLQQLTNGDWLGGDDFYWSAKEMYGKKITLLACAFSVWGDIAGNLIRFLKHKNIKAFFYVGKVGGIFGSHQLLPNQTLATGTVSMFNGILIEWNQQLIIPENISNVQQGKHVTLFSPIAETKEWLERNRNYSFVDPEIGHMALAAQECNIKFSYIHIISDILGQSYNENLSNERDLNVLKKREQSYIKIVKILDETFKYIHLD